MDVARFGDWTTLRHTNAKVRENYARRFSIRFPNEELPAARPAQTTPLYDIQVRDNNAVMGVTWGMEVPLWYAPTPEEARDVLSFHRSNDFPHVAAEVAAVREAVGVTEIANFAKYEVTGPGAEAWLNHLLTNTMPRRGRIVLSPMLNHQGKLIGDFTVAHADADRFLVWGSSAAQIHHLRWFEAHLPGDGSVRIERLGMTLMGLMIAGPRSRELLAALTDHDVSNAAFRFMDHRALDVAGCPALVNRISYTGDLGYEIWVEPAYLRTLYLAIKDAGRPLGLATSACAPSFPCGSRRTSPPGSPNSGPIYGPFEGAMDRFVRLDKNDFIGREAAAEEHATGPRLRRVSLVIDADGADVMGDEPIWARTDAAIDTLAPLHGIGAPRFDFQGRTVPKPDARRDGDWQVAGWVTSGGYGHHVAASLAQGYLPAPLADRGEDGLFQVEILGHRRPARLALDPLFDPAGTRMRM
jgi:dimethylglycine dehydrogenase